MVLVIAGTVAVHLILIVFVDAMVVTHPLVIKAPAPVIEMVEVDVEPPEPPKPPDPPPPDEPPPVQDTAPVPQPPTPQPRTQVRSQPQPPQETPPPNPNPAPPGGDDVMTIPMPDTPTEGKGIAPPPAKGVFRPGGGRGGKGGGAGSGDGQGSGDPAPPPPPVSVATIKTRAMPKGDYGYIDAGKDYPAEARQNGIEGPIRVKLVVDAAGKVQSAVLLNKLGHGLDELALTRAKTIEFEPAKDTDDKAVASVVIWTFNMTLPK
jgi:protein TonB